MSVYVDGMKAGFGRMIMCHMLADSTEELLAMAVAIGVQTKWIQKRGTELEHFDICQSKRRLAVKQGAIEITRNQLGEILNRRRQGKDTHDIADQTRSQLHLGLGPDGRPGAGLP